MTRCLGGDYEILFSGEEKVGKTALGRGHGQIRYSDKDCNKEISWKCWKPFEEMVMRRGHYRSKQAEKRGMDEDGYGDVLDSNKRMLAALGEENVYTSR